MNRLTLAVSTLTLIPLASCSDQEARTQPVKPNIIFIMADDLGYGELSCYGQQKFTTPHIDRLAAEGMRFTNYYSGSTVCAPARSSLLTGLHTGHTPIRGNSEVQPEGQRPMPGDTRTFAHLLKESGYTTGVVGKWGLGYPGSESVPLKMGFDYFFGYNCQRHAHHYFVDYQWENDQRIEYPEKIYSHDETTRKGLEFIRKHKGNPFMLYMAYAIPHAELVLPDEYLEPFRGKYPEPKPWPDGQHYGGQAYPRAALAAMITHLDSDIGRLMQLLEELGIDDNTLVIFTSDNGPHVEGGNDPVFFNSNGGLKGFKRDLYEGGIRVPFIARWPGKIQPGTQSDHIAAHWDMFPTFCELANVTYEAEIDGISMVPALTGKKQTAHDYLYWEFHELGARQAVRLNNWKGVKYNLRQGNAQLELYDLLNDPGETTNIAAENPEVVARIEQILNEARVPSPVFPFPADN
jgi:arylsulfatase A